MLFYTQIIKKKCELISLSDCLLTLKWMCTLRDTYKKLLCYNSIKENRGNDAATTKIY